MNTQPQPNQFKSKGALDAFLNLFSLITLGWTSIAIGIILFQIIDKFLSPGTIDYLSRFSQSGLKFGVASALIVAPIFLLIIGTLHKNYKREILNPQSIVYRWLTYLILLVTALNIIARLIQLVFKLLDGDYALAGILKIFVVLLIAGGIFGYYWYDLKRIDYSKRSQISLIFFILTIIIIAVSIIGSLFIIDSPQIANLKKADQQRANDLSRLGNMINIYYQENDELPENLTTARFSQFKDPKTEESYDYTIISEEKYELCADFSLAVEEDNNDKYYYDGNQDWYYHDAGHQCFTARVNKDEFKGMPLPVERIED